MSIYNFQDCHEEKIHLPGYIQPFGYLLVLDFESWTIEYCSANIEEIFGLKTEALLGKKFRDFPEVYDVLYPSKNSEDFRKFRHAQKTYNPEIIKIRDVNLYYQLYSYENAVYVEFEKVHSNYTNREILLNLGNDILNVEEEQQLWKSLAEEINHIIGYDRVMVYQFLADGTGKVVAENVKEGMSSLLNVHYPETDIPRQARDLYLKKRKRIISNVNDQTVPVISLSDEPLDMTMVSSRAVSPIHIEYLKNSNVESSFSTSIVINGALWGLVTCHNCMPKHVDLHDRQISEILTRITANAFTAMQNREQMEFTREFYERTLAIKNEILLNSEDIFRNSLIINEISQFVEADGMTIIEGNSHIVNGLAPSENDLGKLAHWAFTQWDTELFSTESFSKHYGSEIDLETEIAGLMSLVLDRNMRQAVFWFKKERPKIIQWAGKEEKNIEVRNMDGEDKAVLTPRKSFSIVREEVRGTSESWSRKDIAGATILQNVILETTKEKNVRIAELNRILKEKNDELDTFSYTVSHDLRTPLTVIRLNSEQLLHKLNEDSQKEKVRDIISQVNDVTEMMNDILNLSRVNKSEIKLAKIETQPLIEKVISETHEVFGKKNTKIEINELPAVMADKTMLYQVFQNVIGNAFKYSSRKENPEVSISGKVSNNFVHYYISDNGIGISSDTRDKMFQLFSRQDNALEFKGSGVGLSIVKRLMKRMGGDVDFESKLGEGTVMELIFQKAEE